MTRAEALAEVKFWRDEVTLAEKEVRRKEGSVEDAEGELEFARLMLREAVEALEDYP